jgi:UrcA family protein
MSMNRAIAFGVAGTVLSLVTAPQAIAARDIVVEADAPASMVVVAPVAQMSSENGVSFLRRRLHAAARTVCHVQYRGEPYLYVRACMSGSYHDALDQLRVLRAPLTAETAASSGHLQIVVRSH